MKFSINFQIFHETVNNELRIKYQENKNDLYFSQKKPFSFEKVEALFRYHLLKMIHFASIVLQLTRTKRTFWLHLFKLDRLVAVVVVVVVVTLAVDVDIAVVTLVVDVDLTVVTFAVVDFICFMLSFL